jgi:ATP-binding cassette subfamily B protein
MVAQYYGKTYSRQTLRQKSFADRQGVSILGLSEAAETIGMRSLAVRIPSEKLGEIPLPCIAHWDNNHFVVVHQVKKHKVYVADPAHGLLTYSRAEFVSKWTREKSHEGILVVLEPTPEFYRQSEGVVDKAGFRFLWGYLLAHKKAFGQVTLLMLFTSLLQIAFPFLTRQVVDVGIGQQNVNFLYMIFLAQLALYFGRTVAEFARSRTLLRVGARINIAMISDFLDKLMKLPLSFFDGRTIGDLLQRVYDHQRIEGFLTMTLLSVLFSCVNLITFGIVLAVFNRLVFAIFVGGSILYSIYLLLFLKRRRDLDYKRFAQLSDTQSTLIQFIRGMAEIKLNSGEKQKRWQWQQIQEKLYHLNLDSLTLSQYQQGGGSFLNELKNITIMLIVATDVIHGRSTLGTMMAIQFIVGQLNAPVMQLLGFAQAAQDTQLSLERLGEIHNADEEDAGQAKTRYFPPDRSLYLHNISFGYGGPHTIPVLKDLTLNIPAGKVTAVVGHSGSGKTTLMKLLLKFYQPECGHIQLDHVDLVTFDTALWRQKCGVVMQDGYIFSDTIANNIAIADETIDEERVLEALDIANIREFVASLPLGYETKIGLDGQGLSRGQKQRILIARAIYKNPEYLFFDEATNALDASNEKAIVDNLKRFFHGRTVVVIAHRLSTVKTADQIVVLDKGRIVEIGTHAELTAARGAYYHLVKDQLELEG